MGTIQSEKRDTTRGEEGQKRTSSENKRERKKKNKRKNITEGNSGGWTCHECPLTVFYLDGRLSRLDVLPIRLFDLLLGRLADRAGLLVPLAHPLLLELVGHLLILGGSVVATGLEAHGLCQAVNVLQTTRRKKKRKKRRGYGHRTTENKELRS